MRGPQVRDVMTKLVVKLYPKDSIRQAAVKLATNDISGAPVVQDRSIVGIVSEADLIRAATASGAERMSAVQDVMNSVVIIVSPTASIWEAARLMQRHRVKRLPVADSQGYLVGVISRADLIRVMARDEGESAVVA
jgi:CBS domain-containing protein